MKKLLMLGLPLVAGAMLHAQADPPVATTSYVGTMKTTGCFFQRNQRSYLNKGRINTSLVTNTNCPIERKGSELGVMSPNGKWVPIAPLANTKMINHYRRHRRWRTEVAQNKSVNVRVFATPNGNVVVKPLQ